MTNEARSALLTGPLLFCCHSMFAETLENLLQETGAELAIFCDYEGEAIGCSFRDVDEFDVKLTGAQLGAVTTELQKLVASTGQTTRASYAITTDQRTLLVEALPGHYYVVLSLRCPARVPFARHRLSEVATLFLAEL